MTVSVSHAFRNVTSDLARRVAALRGDRGELDGEAAASALDALAAKLRAGMTPREALVAWCEDVDDPRLETLLRRLSRRLRLGDALPATLEACLAEVFPRDLRALVTLTRVHTRAGGDLAASLDRLATCIRQRAALDDAARAAAAGQVLSGRVVAALPLLFLPLTPAARAPLFDGFGIVLLVCGVGLAAAGFVWIDRLLPRVDPQHADLPWVAATAATLMSAGLGLREALHTAVEDRPPDDPLQRARRRVDLGMTWPDALAASSEAELSFLGRSLRHSHALGVPAATALEALASRALDDRRRAFDATTKRAPVMMVFPLVLCVLPSFGLLALASFLRGLTLG